MYDECRCGCGLKKIGKKGWAHGHHRRTEKARQEMSSSKVWEKRVFSEETRQKMSESKIGKNNPQYGKIGTRLGKKHTLESRQKMSRLKKGKHKGSNNPNWNPNRKEVELRRKIYEQMKHMLKRCVLNKEKGISSLLGYSVKEFREHFENLFEDGMTWDNHGEWHIDHIRPFNTFKIGTSPKIINALSNLRPLWKTENLTRPKDGRDL